MEDRRELLDRLHSERYGPMRRSFEWGRAQLLSDIFTLAGKCGVAPDELNGLSILRYACEFRDLTDDQLRLERQHLSILLTKMAHPANAESVYHRPIAPFEATA